MSPTTAADRPLLICVYCASSESSDERYRQAAHELGGRLALAGHRIVYGGGARGSMGALANGALAASGQVTGIIPSFMVELEWAHPGLAELRQVENMRERKHLMLHESDAVVALPGGCGTFEELFEAMTLKRLGLYAGPIVIVNTLGYYDRLIGFLEQSVEEHFMRTEHLGLWTVVDEPGQVLDAIRDAPRWDEAARGFAQS
ncbi:TIGR00730 family Rossman fold protein [Engelhardtia mirabilis]|uniref:Cytokinin riboside 5'-monophosphate phosphoribohydrolase n=1 Tax=Engelhardtia mirabilis TaxID=2528011 RepID=A0A518BLJ7_9BACT|nr:LOG family protein ORF6 in fasciation locus [Planctomycetes bacterium Pla133]QDV02175.1 LOG family protein ORF6 in fasciation locus [Planctomycetes bacterium Pla86]